MTDGFAQIAYSPTDAAKIAGIGRTTLFEEIKAGRLRALKAGRRTLIRRADLEAWIDALRTRDAA